MAVGGVFGGLPPVRGRVAVGKRGLCVWSVRRRDERQRQGVGHTVTEPAGGMDSLRGRGSTFWRRRGQGFLVGTRVMVHKPLVPAADLYTAWSALRQRPSMCSPATGRCRHWPALVSGVLWSLDLTHVKHATCHEAPNLVAQMSWRKLAAAIPVALGGVGCRSRLLPAPRSPSHAYWMTGGAGTVLASSDAA